MRRLKRTRRPSPTARDDANALAKKTKANLRDVAKRSNFKSNVRVGRLYNYRYFAKWDEELPYWDQNPVTMPIEMYRDGFLGMNFHYIEPMNRAILLNRLLKIGSSSGSGQMTLRLSYEALKGASRLRMFKPCIKRYLYSQVRSRFLEIDEQDWFNVVVMPLARWVRATPGKVYKDSRGKM